MIIGFKSSKINGKSQRESERGQAMVEYLLLMALSLMLIMGFMVQFNGGMREYLEDLFGGYSSCLLETGELPSLGFQGGAPLCTPPKFKWTPSPKSLKTATGTKGNSNSPAAEAKDKEKSQTPPLAQNSSGNSRNSELGSRGAGGQMSSALGIKGAAGLKNRPEKITLKSEKDSSGGAGDLISYEPSFDKYARYRIIKINTKITSKKFRTEKEQEKERPSTRSVQVTENRSRTSKVKVKMKERKPAQETDDASVTEITFGYSLKWLIIIALIVAILLFMGQQIMGYIRSRDL